MTQSTAVVVPSNVQLPARFAGADIAAQIAADNAAAAAGIRVGGFPSINVGGGKFHIKDEGKLETLMNPPAAPGQPALPMMLLEVVVVGGAEKLNKLYYKDKYVEGSDEPPTCSSSNGVTPDSHIAVPQNNVCATCPQNQWGSKVSEISQKDIKACDDIKQLAVIPASDLNYKALGLAITKGSLTDWGKFVAALTARNFPLKELVVNLTFDQTVNYPKLKFSFNRFLTDEEAAKVKERAAGDDVKAIISARSQVPTLTAPVQPASQAAQPVADGQVGTPQAAPSLPPAAAAPTSTVPLATTMVPETKVVTTTGFGAITLTQTGAAPIQPAAEPPKRARRTRAQIEADKAAGVDLSHLPVAIRQAVEAVGVGSEAGRAMLAQFPAPALTTPPPVAASPFDGQPAHVQPAVMAAGGLNSAAGAEVYKALTGKIYAPGTVTTTATPAVPATGFGGTTVPASQTPSAAVISSAASLKAQLEAKLKGVA